MPMRIGGFAAGAALQVEQLDQLDHFQRRAHRAAGAVGQRQRRAEERHQPVADHLVDHAAVAADGVEHQRVVGVEQLDRLFRRLALDQRREAADVGEHHRCRARACRRARSPTAAGPAPPRRWRSGAPAPSAGRAGASSPGWRRCAPSAAPGSPAWAGSPRRPARCSARRCPALERRGHDHRQVAQLRVGRQLLEHLRSRPSRASRCRAAAGRRSRARSISSATRPFSAAATRWPCSSTLRASSRRLTLLSSTISRRAPRSAMAQLLQRGGGTRVLRLQRVDAAASRRRGSPPELQLARQRRPAAARRRCCYWT